MDRLEKIKTEYMLFEEEKTQSAESVHVLLEYYHYEMNCSVKTSNKSIIQNKFDYNIEKIKNAVGQIFGYDFSYDWILADSEYLGRQISLARSFDKYFIRLCDELDDDNFLIVSRLAQFTFDKYLSNYNYLESLRDGVNLASSGITYYGKGDDDRLEFDEFFNDEFDCAIIRTENGVKRIIKDL